MAIKPWVGDLNNSIPTEFQVEKGMDEAPEETLQIQYINGYRNFDCRNMAKLTNDPNRVLFGSAALGVVMDIDSNTQTFFNRHEEDIVSLALHPNKRIVATGQMAMKGKSKMIDIFVWDLESKEILSNLKGFHLRAIQLLKFSPSGKYLMSVGKDDDNSLAVYDWEKNVVISTAKVDKKNVLDLSFSGENDFMTVGSKHIKTWKVNGSRIKGTRVGWSGKAEGILCCQGVDSGYFVGGMSGKVYSVRGKVGRGKQIHKGKVYVMHFDGKNLFTGGQDGKVLQFSIKGGKLDLIKKVIEVESLRPRIRSLDVEGNRMLIGTGASELLVMDDFESGKSTKILDGHFAGELWGLCTGQDYYYTCGDDSTIRKWDLKNRKQVNCVQIESKLRAISLSPDGERLVVGTFDGKIVLLDSDLQQIQTEQTPFSKKNQWIEEIKWSPSGEYVALGAHGGASKVLVYKYKSKLKKYGSIQAGITSALLHLDWDTSSSYVVVNSQAYELKFVDILGKSSIRASAMKDTEWSSWTCKIGFPVQGIYPGVDGTDVNTVDRSQNKRLLATGDDFQLVKIFKYPSVVPKSCFKSYLGHASHVTRVRFMENDRFLISTGGNDKTSIIWKVIGAEEEEEEEDYDFVERRVEREVEEEVEEEEVEGGFLIEEVEETEFMAVKPWLGAIRAPSDYTGHQYNQDEKPDMNVELEYCYGYRSKDCKNNIFLYNNQLIYHAAAIGIKLDYYNNRQQFFNLHDDDIISMDFHRDTNMIATSQLGPKPSIYLWSAENMRLQKTLKGGIIKGVQAVKFSPSGALLAAVCIDDNHMVCVFDVEKEELLGCEKGDTAKIVDLEWYDEKHFLTVGINHSKLWSVKGMKAKRGSFGKNSSKLLFCQRFNGKVLCGSINGTLQIWSSSACQKEIKLQKGALDAMTTTEQGLVLVGGKSRLLHILNDKLKLLTTLNLNKFLLSSQSNKIRAIQVNSKETEIFVGLYSSEIYKLYTEQQQNISQWTEGDVRSEQLMSGHFARNLKWTNEVWGLCALNNKQFLSVSDDGTLRLWDAKERKELKSLFLNIDKKGAKLEMDKKTKDLQEQAKLRSVTVCQEEKHIAIGCKEGTLRIVDLRKWKQIKMIKRRKRWIETLRYSPDNTKLAVGSHDCYIDIYDKELNYKILYKMKKHSSFITHLDWSLDSSYLHSTCGAYELLFWNAESGQQMTGGATALRDEEWATWSTPFGWPVQGVYQPEWDGSDINMVERNHNRENRIIAVADDFGEIRIYKYPCLDKGAKSIVLKGHSSHVTNVKFDDRDQYLYSTGGEDQTVMQWRVTI